MSKDKLIVPKKLLVGIKYPDDHHGAHVDTDDVEEVSVPQAFMIPWADKPDRAMEKRKETVDTWLNGWSRSKNNNKIEIFDNTPMTGFQLADVARRYRTHNALWNVTDPRGFDIELSIENLSWMMTKITIRKGLIEDEMVWVKWKSQSYNLLVPTTDPDYQLALKNTENLSVKKTYLKEADLTVGQEVVLHNEEIFTYMGKAKLNVQSEYYTTRSYGNYNPNKIYNTHETSDEFYVLREKTNYGWVYYNAYKQLPKILSAGKVLPTAELPRTTIDSEKISIRKMGNGYLFKPEEGQNRHYYSERIVGFI